MRPIIIEPITGPKSILESILYLAYPCFLTKISKKPTFKIKIYIFSINEDKY
jgi:hypothetical protein